MVCTGRVGPLRLLDFDQKSKQFDLLPLRPTLTYCVRVHATFLMSQMTANEHTFAMAPMSGIRVHNLSDVLDWDSDISS